MSKRLQVILDDREMREVRQAARRGRMTVAEWVRQALRMARQQKPLGRSDKKLEAVRMAALHSFPTGDIGRVLDEIEQGYLRGSPP